MTVLKAELKTVKDEQGKEYGVIEWFRGTFKVPRTTKCWVCQFARFLVKSGFNEERLLHVHRNGVPVFTDATLRWWSGKTTVENDRQSVHMRSYVPFKGEDE